MPDFLVLALCGGVGALLYAFPIMIAALKLVPPDKFAAAQMGFSTLVGAVMAPIFVPLIGHRYPMFIQPTPYPLAVGIGLAINPLTPVILKKITGFADTFTIGRK